jgi:serpin B
VNADRKVEFTSANSVWVDPEFELLDSYVNTVENNYAASVENVDMGTQKGVDRINKWCSTYTNGKITKFLDEPNDALLVLLTNALYFNGAWKDEFKTVENRIFTHANGTPKYIPTILSSGQYTYYEDECIQLVEILYGNGAYAMDLILPIEDMTLKEAAGYLSEDGVWNNVMNNLSDGYVSLLFPKFRIESDLMLNDMLCKFGMEDAFCSLADFSKMAEDGLMVSFVL